MSLLDTLTAALAPTVLGLTADFGCTVTVYRPVTTPDASGAPIRTYPTADPALTAVPAFFLPDQGSARERPFGVVPTTRGTVRFPGQNGTLPALSPFDGVKVLSGPFAGWTWLCDGESAPDAAGVFSVVTVTSAPAGVLP